MVTKERLAELRAQGLTRQQIAQILGVSLATVKRLLAKHELVVKRPPKPPAPPGPPRTTPESGMTRLEMALYRLQGRVTEIGGQYRLDGKPVSSFRLIQEAGLADA